MTDPQPRPDQNPDTSAPPWVKALVAIALVLILAMMLLNVTLGGFQHS